MGWKFQAVLSKYAYDGWEMTGFMRKITLLGDVQPRQPHQQWRGLFLIAPMEIGSTFTVLFCIAVVSLLASGVPSSRKLPTSFRSRDSQVATWREAFPEASNDEIRWYLDAFAASFAFSGREKWKFSPNDQLCNIYRSLNSGQWHTGALEFNFLNESLTSHYGVSLVAMPQDGLTLGDLFARMRKPK